MNEGAVPPISQTAARLPIPMTESPTKSPKSPQPKVAFQPQVPKKSSPSYFLGQWAGNKFPNGASVQVAGICSDGEDFTSERGVLARGADENGEFVEILDTSWASRLFDGLPFKMALRCTKGKKNFTASPAPNQDNYSITKFFFWVGRHSHLRWTRAVWTLGVLPARADAALLPRTRRTAGVAVRRVGQNKDR